MISAWAPLLRPASRPCPRFGGRFDRVGAVFEHESRNSRAASAPAQPKEVLFTISSRRPTFAPGFRSASAKPPGLGLRDVVAHRRDLVERGASKPPVTLGSQRPGIRREQLR